MDKAELVRKYLSEQADSVFINGLLNPENIQMHRNFDGESVAEDENKINNIDEDEIERFKSIVKLYAKTDTEIKDIKSKVRLLNAESKKRKEMLDRLSNSIISFMSNNEIDELNSKDGIIQYKTSMVKSPLSQRIIREQLYDKFGNNDSAKKLLDGIFEDRQKVQKQSLRRIAY